MKLHNLSVAYPQANGGIKWIIHRLNLHLPSHGMVVVTGESGIGKSTLLKVLAGIITPTHGRLIFPNHHRRPKRIFLEERMHLIPHWRIRDWVGRDFSQQFYTQTGLTPQDGEKPFAVLSGGEKARVLLAVLFQLNAAIYLLDEPSHDLDEANRQSMLTQLQRQSVKHLLIISTHDPLLIKAADYRLHMHSQVLFRWGKANHSVSPSHVAPARTNISDLDDLIHNWKKKLLKQKRLPLLSHCLRLASIILMLATQGLGLTFISFLQQKNWITRAEASSHFLAIQEEEVTSIGDSPFQIVRRFAPNQEQFDLAITPFSGIKVLPDISRYFPDSIMIQDQKVRIHFLDLPFDPSFLSIAWIGPTSLVPKALHIQSITIHPINPIHISLPTTRLMVRSPLSWFEPVQLGLSYWQWFSFLQQMMEDESMTYLAYFQMHQPADALWIYAQDSSSLHSLRTILEHVPHWTVTNPRLKSYEGMTTLLDVGIFINLFLLVLVQALSFFLLWSLYHYLWFLHQATIKLFTRLQIFQHSPFQWISHTFTYRLILLHFGGVGIGIRMMQSLAWFKGLTSLSFFLVGMVIGLFSMLQIIGLRKVWNRA